MNQLSEIPLTFDEAVMQCTNSLQSKKNPEESLHLFLQILAEFYQGSSSYIFELNQEQGIFQCKYQWNTKASVEFLTVLPDLPFSALDYYVTNDSMKCDVPIMTFQPLESPHTPIGPLLKSIQSSLISPILDKGKISSFVALADVDFQNFDSTLFGCIVLFIQESLQKREMYLQLATLHNLDPLTGFFNKTQYDKKIEEFQENLLEEQGLMLIQMNGLKKVEEVFGEKYVDVKIKNVSILLGEYIDQPFYRISSQKFLCFVRNVEKSAFETLMDRIRLETESDKNSCFIASHAWFDGTATLESVILIAEEKLYANQKEVEAERASTSRENLELDLRECMDSNMFMLHLQPKIELSTLKTEGAEILVRRYIPESQNLIPLDSFIPLYEQYDMIRELDLHIFRKVCEILSKWRKIGFETAVSLHLNPMTILESGTAAHLMNICREWNVLPQYIVIEVAKRHSIGSGKIPSLVKEEYKQLNFRLITDYDSDVYSNYLSSTKVIVKATETDKDHDLSQKNDADTSELLRQISEICENMMVGSRNISTDQEKKILKDWLHKLNCSHGQGFFFSKPISIDEFYEQYKDTLMLAF